VEGTDLLERVLEAGNLRRALHQVRRHQGAPGIGLMLGWRAFFGFAEVRSPLRDLDKWVRRRRSDHWKPWGRRGYRELRKRGVGRQWARKTVKSAHGSWRLSPSPALAIARPQRYFATLGRPSLSED
jgi:hypothetical protein